jgi:hypothetical protein
MNKKKIVLLGLGALFLFLGLYYRIYDPAKGVSYEYLGIGTWLAGVMFYAVFPKYKEVASLVLGLVILHAGVVLLLVEKLSNPKLLGLLIFASGIIVVLNCGFSDYLKRRKAKK